MERVRERSRTAREGGADRGARVAQLAQNRHFVQSSLLARVAALPLAQNVAVLCSPRVLVDGLPAAPAQK